jgi:hypothetical protein
MSAEKTPLDKGMGVANAVLALLDPTNAPAEQEHGWTLQQATERLNHLKQSGYDWQVTAAYLACQVYAYRRISGVEEHEAARLALSQIRSALKGYEDRA